MYDMVPIQSYKSLGLVAAGILLCGLAFLITKWPQGRHMTFSQHAAMYRHAIVYYMALFVVTLPLLLLFFIGWFAPTFRMPSWFNMCIIGAVVLQFAVTVIPEVGGWKTKWHRFLAFWSSIFMLPPLGMILFSQTASGLGKIVTLIGVIVMVTSIMVVMMHRLKHPSLLIFQASYYVAFFAAILTVTYI